MSNDGPTRSVSVLTTEESRGFPHCAENGNVFFPPLLNSDL